MTGFQAHCRPKRVVAFVLKNSKSQYQPRSLQVKSLRIHATFPSTQKLCEVLGNACKYKKVDTDLFQQRIIFISKFNSSAYACLDNNWKKHGRHPIIAVLVLQVQALCPPLWHECSHDRTGLRVWNSNRCLLEDYDLLLQSSKRKMNDMNASNGIYHIIYYPRY